MRIKLFKIYNTFTYEKGMNDPGEWDATYEILLHETEVSNRLMSPRLQKENYQTSECCEDAETKFEPDIAFKITFYNRTNYFPKKQRVSERTHKNCRGSQNFAKNLLNKNKNAFRDYVGMYFIYLSQSHNK